MHGDYAKVKGNQSHVRTQSVLVEYCYSGIYHVLSTLLVLQGCYFIRSSHQPMNHDYFCIDEILSHKLVDFFLLESVLLHRYVYYILHNEDKFRQYKPVSCWLWMGNGTLRQHCQLHHSFSKGKPEPVWDKSTHPYSHSYSINSTAHCLNLSIILCI